MKLIHRHLITLPLIVLIGLSGFGCSNSRSAQCQKIIDSVNNASTQLQTLDRTANGDNREESFSQAVKVIEQSVTELEAIKVKDKTLKELKSNLVQIRREMARSIKDGDMDKNVNKFMEIGSRHGNLINDISSYCSSGQPPTVNYSSLTPSSSSSSPVTTKPVSTSPDTPPPKPKIDTYTQALDQATGATVIAQSAITKSDWELVASRWKKAINLLKTVPASHPNYATAQNKISDYQANLAVAQTQIKEVQRDYWQEALNLGMNAAQSVQSAQSISDWKQVANNWNLAIKHLETIPLNSPNYTKVRAKIIEYQQNLSIANEKAIDAATADYCQPQIDPIKSEELVVSNLQLYSEPNQEESFVYGCITNQSNQTLSQIGVAYGYMYENGMGAGLTSLTDYDFTLKPGKTMVFKSSFSVDKDVPEIEVSFMSEAGIVETIITR